MESITLTEMVPLTCGIYRICLVPRYLASSPSISLASLLFTKLQAPQRLILKLNTFVFAFRTLHWFFLLSETFTATFHPRFSHGHVLFINLLTTQMLPTQSISLVTLVPLGHDSTFFVVSFLAPISTWNYFMCLFTCLLPINPTRTEVLQQRDTACPGHNSIW